MAFNINDVGLNIKCPKCGAVGNFQRFSAGWSNHLLWQKYRCKACGTITTGKVLADIYPQFRAEFLIPSTPPVELKPQVVAVVDTLPKLEPELFPYEGIPYEKCPECGELPSPQGRFDRAGKDKRKGYYVFRWLCRKCNKRFSEKRREGAAQ